MDSATEDMDKRYLCQRLATDEHRSTQINASASAAHCLSDPCSSGFICGSVVLNVRLILLALLALFLNPFLRFEQTAHRVGGFLLLLRRKTPGCRFGRQRR